MSGNQSIGFIIQQLFHKLHRPRLLVFRVGALQDLIKKDEKPFARFKRFDDLSQALQLSIEI